tara:strand:- start:364 stop:549 length:186 start_codon:yes stop_codon:yes gene_type:complete
MTTFNLTIAVNETGSGWTTLKTIEDLKLEEAFVIIAEPKTFLRQDLPEGTEFNFAITKPRN